MRNLSAMRDRFVRDRLPVRLGNLASNLARLGDWAVQGQSCKALLDLMGEIAHQMDWSGEAGLEEVADMQREVCSWRRAWPTAPTESVLALRARAMSERLLELSGLLDGSSQPGREAV